MTTDITTPAAADSRIPLELRAQSHRVPDYVELTRFYRAIGISAVASAAQAAKMTAKGQGGKHALPAFLRDAHAVG